MSVQFFARQQSSCEWWRGSVLLHGHGRTSIGWRGGDGSAGFENYSREQARRLVLVDANPLVNIRGTEKIWRVIKDGQLFDLGKLKEPAARETIAES